MASKPRAEGACWKSERPRTCECCGRNEEIGAAPARALFYGRVRVAMMGQPQIGQYSVIDIMLPGAPVRPASALSSFARICAWAASPLQRLA